MSEEKQVKEIAKAMCTNYGECHNCMLFPSCNVESFALRLHEADYRKQSEIVRCGQCVFGEIDEESGSVHCSNRDTPWHRYNDEFVLNPNDYCRYAKPEAPKRKGGAE